MVKGGDESTRSAAVNDMMAFLNTMNGVSDLERDAKAGKDEIIIQLRMPSIMKTTSRRLPLPGKSTRS